MWLMKRYRISAHHFRQNRHFPKGPFAISFEFLFTVWRFWQLGAIFAIFANACISGHISDGHSVNDGIGKDHFTVQYMKVDEIIYGIMSLGRGTLLAKLDVESVYRIIPVHP